MIINTVTTLLVEKENISDVLFVDFLPPHMTIINIAFNVIFCQYFSLNAYFQIIPQFEDVVLL